MNRTQFFATAFCFGCILVTPACAASPENDLPNERRTLLSWDSSEPVENAPLAEPRADNSANTTYRAPTVVAIPGTDSAGDSGSQVIYRHVEGGAPDMGAWNTSLTRHPPNQKVFDELQPVLPASGRLERARANRAAETKALVYRRLHHDQENLSAFRRIATELYPDVKADALAGYVDAQVALAYLYYADLVGSQSTKGNQRVGREWFIRAAQQGDEKAMFMVGRSLYYGWGMRMDRARAALLVRPAAADGHPPAAYYLAMAHRFGVAEPEHDESHMHAHDRWMAVAARGDYENSRIEIGRRAVAGHDVGVEVSQVKDWLVSAFGSGQRDGAFYMSQGFKVNGLFGRNDGLAYAWHQAYRSASGTTGVDGRLRLEVDARMRRIERGLVNTDTLAPIEAYIAELMASQ